MAKKINKEDLINLSGQVVNGMLSADSSYITKLLDHTLKKQVADSAVDIAKHMLEKIDEEIEKQEN